MKKNFGKKSLIFMVAIAMVLSTVGLQGILASVDAQSVGATSSMASSGSAATPSASSKTNVKGATSSTSGGGAVSSSQATTSASSSASLDSSSQNTVRRTSASNKAASSTSSALGTMSPALGAVPFNPALTEDNLIADVAAAADGETITLAADITLTKQLTVTTNCIIDGDGFTLTADNGLTGYMITSKAMATDTNTFTVNNLNIDGQSGLAVPSDTNTFGGGGRQILTIDKRGIESYDIAMDHVSITNCAVQMGGGAALYIQNNPTIATFTPDASPNHYSLTSGPVVTATINDCRFENNNVGYGGGAIYACPGLHNNYTQQNPINLSVTGSTFISNSAGEGSGGGAILVYPGNSAGKVLGSNVTLKSDTFKQNYLFGDAGGAANQHVYGGAVFTQSANLNVSQTYFKDNTGYRGGALAALACSSNSAFATLTMNDNEFDGNKTALLVNPAANTSTCNLDGAAVFLNVDQSDIRNTTFSNNSSFDDGGAIYTEYYPGDNIVNSDGTTGKSPSWNPFVAVPSVNNFSNCTMFGNQAHRGNSESSSGGGGVIQTGLGTTQNFTDCTMTDNTTGTATVDGGYGGAIVADYNGVTTVRNCIIVGNQSTNGGTAKDSDIEFNQITSPQPPMVRPSAVYLADANIIGALGAPVAGGMYSQTYGESGLGTLYYGTNANAISAKDVQMSAEEQAGIFENGSATLANNNDKRPPIGDPTGEKTTCKTVAIAVEGIAYADAVPNSNIITDERGYTRYSSSPDIGAFETSVSVLYTPSLEETYATTDFADPISVHVKDDLDVAVVGMVFTCAVTDDKGATCTDQSGNPLLSTYTSDVKGSITIPVKANAVFDNPSTGNYTVTLTPEAKSGLPAGTVQLRNLERPAIVAETYTYNQDATTPSSLGGVNVINSKYEGWDNTFDKMKVIPGNPVTIQAKPAADTIAFDTWMPQNTDGTPIPVEDFQVVPSDSAKAMLQGGLGGAAPRTMVAADLTNANLTIIMPDPAKTSDIVDNQVHMVAKFMAPSASTYDVRFLNYDNSTILDDPAIAAGTMVNNVPKDPNKANSTFTGWLSSIDNKVYTAAQISGIAVNADTTYTAQFTATASSSSSTPSSSSTSTPSSSSGTSTPSSDNGTSTTSSSNGTSTLSSGTTINTGAGTYDGTSGANGPKTGDSMNAIIIAVGVLVSAFGVIIIFIKKRKPE